MAGKVPAEEFGTCGIVEGLWLCGVTESLRDVRSLSHSISTGDDRSLAGAARSLKHPMRGSLARRRLVAGVTIDLVGRCKPTTCLRHPWLLRLSVSINSKQSQPR